jgi:hypothetical protein
MPELLMLCPSRSRPGNIRALREAWGECTSGNAELLIAVDDDDPELAVYQADGPVRVLSQPRRLGPILNALATELAPSYQAIGFLGDDHRPRTTGWDQALLAVLDGKPGVAYGNDLFQGQALPTAVVLSAAIVQGLGYLVPPGVEHMYLDNFWRRLGDDIGHLEYLPDVLIEHLHPAAGKAAWDAGYERVNTPAQFETDRVAYEQFLETTWPGDLIRLGLYLGQR